MQQISKWITPISKWATPLGAFGIALIVGSFLLRLVFNLRADIVLLLAGVGIVLVGFYIITRPRDEQRQASGLRIASQGGNVVLFALAFIGIIIAVNYIVAKQFPQRLDLTANQQHTLSDQTVQVLASLTEPVQVIGFFPPQMIQAQDQAQEVLKEYQLKSTNLTVQYVDPDANPALAQKYDNALPGTLVFAKDGRTEKVYQPYDENAVTNALLKVTQTTQPAIYFTTGHGEFNPKDTAEAGYAAVEDYLKQINYKVDVLNTAVISGTIPADTSAIVIAGPTEKFSPDDDALFKNYLDKGGRILLMAEPNTDLGLTETLKDWGVEVVNDVVLEPTQNFYGNTPAPVITDFPDTPVTSKMQGLQVFFPYVRSIKAAEGSDKQQTALFTTTAEACEKTDFAKLSNDPAIQCDAADPKGPFVLGYAIEGAGTGGSNPDARSRLIVLGNATFATNNWINNQAAGGNQQLLRNMINWLAGQENLISIAPRDASVRSLGVLSANEINLIFATTVGLVPLAALVIGGFLWWQRR